METTLPQNKKALIWLNTSHFVNDIFTGMLNPIMPFIAAKIGISMAIATIVLTVSHIFSSLLQPVFGFLADSIHKRSFIFWGLIMSSCFIPLAGVANHFIPLILVIMIGSLGSSFFHPQALGFTSRFAKNSGAPKAMAIFLALGTVGYSCGPLISAGITQYLGMDKMPFLSVIGVTCALLMFKCVPKVSLANEKLLNFKIVFKSILSNRRLNILNIIAMLKTMVHSACFILLPFLWKGIGHKPIYIGVALFMFIFIGAFGSMLSSSFEKLVGTRNVFYTSMVFTLPLMIVFVFTYQNYPVFSLFIFVVMGFVTMLATPVTMLMAQNVLPEYKSIISGFINGFSWGVVGIVMSAMGFVAENLGITNVLIGVSIIPAVCSIMVKELFKPQN